MRYRSPIAVALMSFMLGGCQALTTDNIVAASAVCWMNECELFYPTKVSVPSYHDVGVINQRYEPQRNYYMDELACMNNAERCESNQSTPHLIYKRHIKPYVNK